MKKIETKIAKFEEGKTYFLTWNEDTGRPHMRRYTIEKRTAKTVVISGSRSKIYFSEYDGGSEFAKVGYGMYIYAKNVYGESAQTKQNETDKAWNEIEANAARRMAELKATELEREEIMSTPLTTAEAFEIAVDAEIENANKASKAAKKNYSINPVIGDDDNMKLNHVDIYTKGNKVEISGCFECKNIETAYRRFRKIMIQIDADHPELQLGGENDWLPANKITLVSTGEKYEEHFCGYNENGDMIFSASPVEALAVDINEDWFYFYGKFTIENIKEETQMTNNLPTGLIEVANGADAFALVAPYFPNGLIFKCAGKGFNHETIFSFADKNDDELWLNVCSTADDNRIECVEVLNTHENGSKRHPLTVAIVANEKDYYKERVELADKIRRDAQPCDDNDEAFNLIPDVSELNDVEIDETSPVNTLVADIEEDDVEELNPIVETKITKRSIDSVSLKLNGKRISLRNLEDALDAPRTNFTVINEYGKKYDCRHCSKDYYGFFGTSPEKYTINFNTLGELVKHYAFDNIVHDIASETPVDSTLTADIAKYQAAFDTARQISIRAGSGVCKINGEEEIWFNYGELRSISSDNYRAEITFNNGRKRFRYRGIVIKRADFLDAMNNEIVAAEQKETFGEFLANYQMPDTALDPNADYFQIRIFPKFANCNEGYFHATANDFNRALELINQFKTLDLPFVGTIKRNTVCGEEYYRHNRDGSETINPPEIDNTPADKEPYRPFTLKEEVDIIKHNINWAKGILATMQGDTYTDDIGEEWTRSELETAITDWQNEIADLQPQADKTAEPPKPVELVAPTVMSARSLRDSINRAIKTCVKNRIAYRKNHNAEMEKYEYELMHLLQAARRELEVA